MERRIAQIEKETGTVLEEMQKKAVVEAAGNGLLYLQEDQVPVKLPRSMQLFVFFEGEGATFFFVWQHLQDAQPSE